jgi:hypothetical protein
MATFIWEAYYGSSPAWTDISTNTIVFAGSGGIATAITLGDWNSETHIGTGDPGTDVCTTNHVPNVKYVGASTFDNGSGTQDLNDTNLTATECTLRVRFTDASSVATSGGRIYCFDGTTETTEATGVEVYAFEQGKSNTAWVQINDDSADVGGDNSGERLTLADQTAATEHIFYIAISARPETVGAKTAFDFGIALTYS